MSTYFKKGSAGAIIITLIAVILLGIAIWYLNSSHTASEVQNATSTPGAVSDLIDYKSPLGYEFSYPKAFALKENADVNELAAPAKGTVLTLPASYFAGSTISPSQSHIAVVASSTTCGVLAQTGEGQNNDANMGSAVLNGKTFAVAAWAGAGAGHVYQTDAYYINQNGNCFMLTLTTDTGNPGNYGGTQQEIDAKNATNVNTRANIKKVFDQIAATFILTPAQTFSEVKIPLFVDQANQSFEGSNAGCDKVTYVARSVTPPTTQPLNAVYKELFARKEQWPYSDTKPGNFITTQKDLSFDNATIVNGVAKVYLKGSTGPLAGVCDDPRLKNELTAAATQFSSVKSVEFYLNGKQVDLKVSEKGE